MGSPDRIYSGAGFAVFPAPTTRRVVEPERIAVANPAAGKWALLVSGEKISTNPGLAANIDSAKAVLSQSLGVPLGNMTVVDNPTKMQLCDSINAMAKRCPKLYVYLSGHGFKGGFVLSGGDISAQELASKLKSLQAGEYCINVNACHGGSFLPVFRDSGLAGFHMASADSDSLGLFWGPGQDTWVDGGGI